VLAVGFAVAILVVGWYRIDAVNQLADVQFNNLQREDVTVLTFGSAGCTAALSRLRSLMALLVVTGTMAASAALIQIPFLANALNLQPLHWDDWLFVFVGASIPTFLLITRDTHHLKKSAITHNGS
jgi:hypothetical protein